MADYNGTDEDDIIDASELASDINHIYPGKGNDTVTNAKSGQTIISSPVKILYLGLTMIMLCGKQSRL